MAVRISALNHHYRPGISGKPGEPGVILHEITDFSLQQVAAWPQTLAGVGTFLQQHIDSEGVAGPCQSMVGNKGTMLRIEPLKWWLLGSHLPRLESELAMGLDLSHARSRVRISGPQATALLNLQLPLDLRPDKFLPGAVGSSMIHHPPGPPRPPGCPGGRCEAGNSNGAPINSRYLAWCSGVSREIRSSCA